MRDNWRADDNHRDEAYPRERGRRDRQERSPAAASHRRQDTDVGLKIRGTAKLDNIARSVRDPDLRRKDLTGPIATRRRSGSPRRPVGPKESEGHFSPERPRQSDRGKFRREGDLFDRRRRSRSRSSIRETPHHREEHWRARSPVYSTRTDRGVGSRRLDRAFSPFPISPRIDHYSSAHEESGPRTHDSYVPGRRHRSRSPVSRDEYRPAPIRRRSPSPAGRHKPRDRSPVTYRYRSSEKLRDSSTGRHILTRARSREDQIPRPREASQERSASIRRARKRSPLPTQEEAKLEHVNRNRQRSPEIRDKPRDRKAMYPSGQPSHSMQQGYPAHDQSRRPPPVNTQYTYSASPQWTPVSSHHASPHSASPYSQAHAGWGGQQQYQGQPTYVSIFTIEK